MPFLTLPKVEQARVVTSTASKPDESALPSGSSVWRAPHHACLRRPPLCEKWLAGLDHPDDLGDLEQLLQMLQAEPTEGIEVIPPWDSSPIPATHFASISGAGLEQPLIGTGPSPDVYALRLQSQLEARNVPDSSAKRKRADGETPDALLPAHPKRDRAAGMESHSCALAHTGRVPDYHDPRQLTGWHSDGAGLLPMAVELPIGLASAPPSQGEEYSNAELMAGPLGIAPECIERIKNRVGVHKALKLLVSLNNGLHSVGLTDQDIVKIAGNGGGAQALAAVLNQFPALLQAGFTVEQIVKIASNIGGAQALAAVLNQLPALHQAGLTVEQIFTVASKPRGGSGALSALANLLPSLQQAGITNDQIVGIAKKRGAKGLADELAL